VNGPCPPERLVSQGNFVLQPPYPPPVPVVVETINTTAFSPLSCGSFAYHPRLGHRARPWTIRSPTSLIVGIKESTTHAANLVVFPNRLPLPSTFSRARLPPTFWSSARHLCVSVPPPPPQQHTQPPFPPFHHTPLFFIHVPGTNPLTVNHVQLQTRPHHFTYPH
jgi:hypothetical protein